MRKFYSAVPDYTFYTDHVWKIFVSINVSTHRSLKDTVFNEPFEQAAIFRSGLLSRQIALALK